MASDIKPRVKIPDTAAAGEVITVKTLITHPMESGMRQDSRGELVPRRIIHRFTCDFAGVNVVDVQLEPAVSSNPYFEFDIRIDAAGDAVFTWYDDDGSTWTETHRVEIA